jgi:hypothetical protein
VNLFQSATPARTIKDIVGAHPSAAALYYDLGKDPGLRQRSDSLLAQMKSLIRAEIDDFRSFHECLQLAAGRQQAAGKMFSIRNRELLDELLAAGEDELAVLHLLNRDPVYEQIPFMEHIPLTRNGETVWVTPIEHSFIRKSASNPALFEKQLNELESLYSSPHRARSEFPRIRILESIRHLRREAKRKRPYLPATLRTLEARIASFEKDSVEPGAIAIAEVLSTLLLGCERIQSYSARSLLRRLDPTNLRSNAAELASLYLAEPRLHQPWLTSHVVTTLLAPVLCESVRWIHFGLAKQIALIRNELRTGSYDSAELTARIRHLESKGLYVSSMVFPLLQLYTTARQQKGAALGGAT